MSVSLSSFPVLNPLLILGNTTVNETDTLDIVCDASDSSPLPSTEWTDSQGTVLSTTLQLTIEDIQRNMTGTYVCVATELTTQLILIQSVNVTVQCKYSYIAS